MDTPISESVMGFDLTMYKKIIVVLDPSLLDCDNNESWCPITVLHDTILSKTTEVGERKKPMKRIRFLYGQLKNP